MREKFRQFMIGRYGTDGLNQFLSMSSIVMLLVSLLTRISLFTWLGAALLILCYYRSLSRNISKRTEENYRFYSLKDRFNNKFRSLKEQWANRKLYHYYRCPQCRQKLRVPRGRGRIQISCQRCGTRARPPQTAVSAAAPSTRYTVYFGAAPTPPTTAPT